ncbi:MAG: hypothetical protein ACK6AH_06620 [Gemmatimonadota bacterium]|jgi:uncharacterized membrane protein|nr:hypothetical protein [Gemmatimonadota bacterium]
MRDRRAARACRRFRGVRWVAASGLLLVAVVGCRRAARPRIVHWTAVGTEPSWRVEVATHAITLKRPGVPDVVVPPVPPSPVVPRGADPRDSTAVVGRVWRSRPAASAPLLELVVTTGACRDGMSDREYPSTATVRWGDVAYRGCALAGPLSADREGAP